MGSVVGWPVQYIAGQDDVIVPPGTVLAATVISQDLSADGTPGFVTLEVAYPGRGRVQREHIAPVGTTFDDPDGLGAKRFQPSTFQHLSDVSDEPEKVS